MKTPTIRSPLKSVTRQATLTSITIASSASQLSLWNIFTLENWIVETTVIDTLCDHNFSNPKSTTKANNVIFAKCFIKVSLLGTQSTELLSELVKEHKDRAEVLCAPKSQYSDCKPKSPHRIFSYKDLLLASGTAEILQNFSRFSLWYCSNSTVSL